MVDIMSGRRIVADMLPIVVRFLHEQEAVDEADGGEDGAPPQRPAPAHSNVDKTGDHRCKLSAHGERPAI